MRSPTLRRAGLAVGLVALAYLLVLPLRSGTTSSTLFTYTLMFTSIGVAVNWNLTGGFTGYVDFGHAVWFGIGAYTTAIVMSLQTNGLGIGWPPVPAIILGALVSGALAAAIGRATMRLKGPYFSIAMLGTFVAMREIVRVSSGLTGGGVGLTLPPYLNRQLFYYVELALVVALVAISWWFPSWQRAARRRSWTTGMSSRPTSEPRATDVGLGREPQAAPPGGPGHLRRVLRRPGRPAGRHPRRARGRDRVRHRLFAANPTLVTRIHSTTRPGASAVVPQPTELEKVGRLGPEVERGHEGGLHSCYQVGSPHRAAGQGGRS